MSIKSFLVIGCGAREYAIVKSLIKNPNALVCCIGNYYNAGLAKICNNYQVINLSHRGHIREFCMNKKINYVIFGPEVPLAAGLVDYLQDITCCIGPTKKLALIESSKLFARQLLDKYNMNKYNPEYIIADYSEDNDVKLLNKINSKNMLIKYNNNVVIKANGLHSGKGVIVCDQNFTQCQIMNYIDKILLRKESVVIEERLVGDEFSLISITDGTNFKHFSPVMDFKRLKNGNKGPNTGSMGCILDNLHYLNKEDIKEAQKVNEMTIFGLQDKFNEKYKGFLYGSFMKTKDGLKVIEFNCRLGDPEAIVLLESMENSLTDVCESLCYNELDKLDFRLKNKKYLCKYVVPYGYPTERNDGFLGIKDLSDEDRKYLYFGALEKSNYTDIYKMRSSRAIAVCKSFDDELDESSVDSVILKMNGSIYYRTDLVELYNKTKPVSQYELSGVNINNANTMVSNIQSLIKSTYNQNVLNNESSFGGMYSLPRGYNNPVLVSSTDGVGTKSILVKEYYGNKGYEIIGQDLVNHCINDILVQGAHPLFFLDYFGSSKLDEEALHYFIKGVSNSCKKYGCALLGGETAEMPDVYNKNHDDVVGTIVGLVEKDKIINGKRDIKVNDIVIALPSSGPHTNGYSLIRKLDLEKDDDLCNVHRCYLNDINKLRNNGIQINGLAHITGGGLIDNPPRVLSEGLEINYTNFEISPLFKKIQKKGDISDNEMKKVFNCGVGMLIIVSEDYNQQVLDLLDDSYIIGNIKMI